MDSLAHRLEGGPALAAPALPDQSLCHIPGFVLLEVIKNGQRCRLLRVQDETGAHHLIKQLNRAADERADLQRCVDQLDAPGRTDPLHPGQRRRRHAHPRSRHAVRPRRGAGHAAAGLGPGARGRLRGRVDRRAGRHRQVLAGAGAAPHGVAGAWPLGHRPGRPAAVESPLRAADAGLRDAGRQRARYKLILANHAGLGPAALHAALAWADACPYNFAHWAVWVRAELAAVRGQAWPAWRGYDAAIALVRRNGFIHDEALATARAARLCQREGLLALAEPLRLRGQRVYANRGAAAWTVHGTIALQAPLHTLLAQLQAGLPPDQAPTPTPVADAAARARLLQQLQALLQDDDADAAAFTTTHETLLREALGARFDALRAAVNAFQFSDALNLLEPTP